MKETFFEPDFNMEDYICDRLLEIEDENDRREMRDVMQKLFVPFYTYVEAAYHDFTKAVRCTQNQEKRRYEVITGIKKCSDIDIADDVMNVMDVRDLEKTAVDAVKMQKAVRQGQTFKLMQVFLQMDAAQIDELKREVRTFQAVIDTDCGEYYAGVRLKQNLEYIRQIEELYHLFEKNNVKWRTVCAPYLHKMFDVELIETECSENECIEKITVDFEEYTPYVMYEMVPVWNIDSVKRKTSAYPELIPDNKRFHHCIFKEKMEPGRDYLVSSTDAKIWNSYLKAGDMHIICDKESPVVWNLTEFRMVDKALKKKMLLFGNCSDGDMEGGDLHTYGGIEKYLYHSGYEEYLTLKEIRQDDTKFVLVFKAVNTEFYLNRDIMRYLVRAVQDRLPEFECSGELE